MFEAIENAVQTILDNAGILYAITYHGEKQNALSGNSTMEEWGITLFKSNSSKHKGQSFEYFTGFEYRETVRGFKAVHMQNKTSVSGPWRATKSKTPHIAGFLYSALLDMQASEESFNNWCDNFGYDSDSIKAFNTYQACNEVADKLKAVIPHACIAQLREALQDY